MDIQEQFFNSIKENNIKKVKALLTNPEVFPQDKYNWAIIFAAQEGYYDIVELLFNDKRVNPAYGFNFAIKYAASANHFNIVNLLWQDKRVRNNLQQNNSELYNELIKKDKLKKKVEVF